MKYYIFEKVSNFIKSHVFKIFTVCILFFIFIFQIIIIKKLNSIDCDISYISSEMYNLKQSVDFLEQDINMYTK